MLKHNVLDGIIWKTGSQCLGTGMTKESSVKHWDDKKRSTGMTPFVVFNKVRT
ncbi:MAG: hypothetical protein ACEY3M_04650 [Wolbachia sp.]